MKIEDTDVGRSLTDPWELDNVHNFSAETLLASIMIKGAQLEPLFSDPVFFYRMNAQWWTKWKPTFEGWCTVLEKEYEPLWDRNSFIEIAEHTDEEGTLDTATTDREVMDDDQSYTKHGNKTEVTDDDTTYSKSGNSKEVVDDTISGTLRAPGASGTNSSFTENEVSAFDSSTYQPHDTSSTTINKSEDTTGKDDRITTLTYSESGSGTDDKTVTDQWGESGSSTDDRTTNRTGSVDTDTTGTKDHTHSEHAWGNAGISMTSQKLLLQELEVRYWNIYEHMSDIFLDEMAVRVF